MAAKVPCPMWAVSYTHLDVYKRQVEDNLNQREEILPSERAKALKMQLEAIKHQGSRTSGQIDPKDAGKRSNEIVAERNKMAVKQVQRYIRLNELVPDLMKLMEDVYKRQTYNECAAPFRQRQRCGTCLFHSFFRSQTPA